MARFEGQPGRALRQQPHAVPTSSGQWHWAQQRQRQLRPKPEEPNQPLRPKRQNGITCSWLWTYAQALAKSLTYVVRMKRHWRKPAHTANRRWQAPVAQLDRALPSEGRGHRFESCRVRQPTHAMTPYGIRPRASFNGARGLGELDLFGRRICLSKSSKIKTFPIFSPNYCSVQIDCRGRIGLFLDIYPYLTGGAG